VARYGEKIIFENKERQILLTNIFYNVPKKKSNFALKIKNVGLKKSSKKVPSKLFD
jgi:hypothetical protein